MTLTPSELQLIGGGVIFATALGSYWYFKRRSDRAAANINKTEQHSDQFDKIMQTLEEDNGNKRQGGDRRKNPEQRRVHQRPLPGTTPGAGSNTRKGAIEEALGRKVVEPKPRVSPQQASTNRVRDQQEEELRRRRRQNDEDGNLLTTMAVIQSSNLSDDSGWRLSKDSDDSSFKAGGGSFGGGGSSASWGGDSGSSSPGDSSSSSDSGSSSSSD